MKFKKQLICFVLICAFLLSTAVALTINIDVNPAFSENEQIFFNYTITSDTDQQIQYIPRVDCPLAPQAFLETKTAELKANVPYQNIYSDITVDDSLEPQACNAYIQITVPVQNRVEKTFEIKTNPSFEFNVLLDKKVFVKSENIKINYNSEVENPEITTTLTYPDKTTKQLILPATIKAEQIGTYTLDVTASKQSYKTIKQKTQFGVVNEEPVIKSVAVCNSNSICEKGETAQNCPQDCPLQKLSKPFYSNLIWIISGLIIAALIICLVIYFRNRKKII